MVPGSSSGCLSGLATVRLLVEPSYCPKRLHYIINGLQPADTKSAAK
ncbi:hypothetical protein APTSU1_000779100 [Apodemus speciosus]|uniref:Uncharacterized protein n=1 Tax=Apodemus speciosus TaxID=105296 RepID=A0ABQ0F022_APOSI